MKVCSTLLVMMEMQIKTVMKYYFTVNTMAIITKIDNKVIIKKKKLSNNKC